MNKKRPAIVVVLGHVDHGKTTLLDTIRNSSVQLREIGGITQKTHTTRIKTPQGDFTFIDTPGHAAFSQMRSRGAKIADIALLVVAADDGPMPQTQEAIDYIKETKIPFMVVITKTDLPSADTQKTLSSLEEKEILFEGRGGTIPYVEISAKNKKGIDNLLEVLNLLSQLTDYDTKDTKFSAVVTETNKDKKGLVVSAIIKSDSLKVGDTIVSDNHYAKVKGIFSEDQKPITQALPGDCVTILGFSSLPPVGSIVQKTLSKPNPETQKNPLSKIPKMQKGQLPVIIKSQTTGSLEAISQSLPKEFVIVKKETGDVTDADVFFAKTSNSPIFAFESKVPQQVKRLAETEGVSIYHFNLIYDLIKKADEILSSSKEKYLGQAQVLAIFPFSGKKVAGCKVSEGEITLGDTVKVQRKEEVVLPNANIISLKREKENIPLARSGEECGILLDTKFDFEEGDVILSVNSNQKKQNG
jgi:translation initiation factor IF-2